jgi:hypothetical protein
MLGSACFFLTDGIAVLVVFFSSASAEDTMEFAESRVERRIGATALPGKSSPPMWKVQRSTTCRTGNHCCHVARAADRRPACRCLRPRRELSRKEQIGSGIQPLEL